MVVSGIFVGMFWPKCALLSQRTSCVHHFPWNCKHISFQRRAHGVVNMGGVVKTLWCSNSQFFYRRSIFCTAGSFEPFYGSTHQKRRFCKINLLADCVN